MEFLGFRVLGPVRVCTGDRSVPPAGPRQERILAALLLDAGRVVPVERLVDVVWDGEPPATATRQVRNVTTALRRDDAGFCEDVLTAEGPGFVLRPPALDLRDFEAHAECGEYREALACWRGPGSAAPRWTVRWPGWKNVVCPLWSFVWPRNWTRAARWWPS